MLESKKLKIKETLKNTKLRRGNLDIKTYELKIDKSKLSKKTKEKLEKLFLEAKWLYNYLLSMENRKLFDSKITKVMVKNKEDNLEERELSVISSQMKQSINARIDSSIHALSVLKKNGNKVGKLKFKSFINSIPLKQYDNTYRIFKDYKKIKIQGIKDSIHVNGIQQLEDAVEFANATLLRKCGDYYLKVTCYENKKERVFKEDSIGIDFGIENNLTLSNGETFNIKVEVSKKTKKLHKKLSRIEREIKKKLIKEGKTYTKKYTKKLKKSKNKIKLIEKLKKSYAHTNNIKKDQKNKIVSYIVNNFKIVCLQDENIKGWQEEYFGVQINQSSMGGIIRDLVDKSHTSKKISKWYASTQTCRKCGEKTYHSLDKREYVCGNPNCGYKHPSRDVHSACGIEEECMRELGLFDKFVPRESRSKPVEKETSTALRGGKSLSVKQEANII